MTITPDKHLESSRKWKIKNKRRNQAYQKNYKLENKEGVSTYNQEYYQRDPEHQRRRRNLYVRNERIMAIAEYGGKCVCCGNSTYEFLTFDHINNDGAAHRREIGSKGGAHFVTWLKKNGWPKDIIQLLCMNCNHAKDKYGACPHGGV